MIRVIYLAHECPGRLRLRAPALRHAPEVIEPLADRLAALPGMEEVRIRPFTGSVLCRFDPYQLRSGAIIDAVRSQTGIDLVLRPGERSTEEEVELARAALENGSALARAFAAMFKNLNLEVLRLSDGQVDLGTLAAAAFAAAGAAEVAATGKLPLPPWFNLGWWAFRTFTTLEKTAIERAPDRPGREAPQEEAAPA